MGNIRILSNCASGDRKAYGCVAHRQEYRTLPECVNFDCRIYVNGFESLEAEEGGDHLDTPW
jgi:hypothetical protein